MSSQPQTFAERAAVLTSYGIPVIPLRPRSKIAFVKGWENLATTDARQIAEWNKQNPTANCAAVARSDGFWFWDVDNAAVFEQMEKETGHTLDELDTLIVKSSGEKRHFYFKHDDCSRIMGNRNCTVDGKEAFSVRAHNRYVVAAGSIHPDTGEPYEFVREPMFGGIPVAPHWLTEWVMRQRIAEPRAPETISVEVPTIHEGGRDNWIFEQSCKLRDDRYPEEIVLTLVRDLNQKCCRPPLSDTDVERKVKSAFTRAPRGEAILDDPENTAPALLIPEYPIDTLDGDLIGELTHALSDGTFIPPQFVRENIKLALGSILDGFVGYPNHEDLHLREYVHNVSNYPQSGKGESYKRTIAEGTGFLFALLKKFAVCVIDGGLFGSGEFMAKVLVNAPTHRSITRFDEMSEVWTKTKVAGCILEKKFLELYEGTAIAQGSFKNGMNVGSDLHYNHVGDFTKDSFDASFTGSGSRGSGYLSRCVFQFAEKQPWGGDWLPIETEKVRGIVSQIDSRISAIVTRERIIPSESAEAKFLRLEFYKWLDTQDARYTPRLKDHLKRDVLLRLVFQADGWQVGELGGVITAEMMRRSIAWCKNQLENRLALFPEDAGSAVEIMERCILRCLKANAASERDLKRACHVDRAGSGGHEVFNRAVRSLLFGHEIRTAGKTRKGAPAYALFDETEQSPKV